jgi:hypothetical protein
MDMGYFKRALVVAATPSESAMLAGIAKATTSGGALAETAMSTIPWVWPLASCDPFSEPSCYGFGSELL